MIGAVRREPNNFPVNRPRDNHRTIVLSYDMKLWLELRMTGLHDGQHPDMKKRAEFWMRGFISRTR